jgi:hypothetical protein
MTGRFYGTRRWRELAAEGEAADRLVGQHRKRTGWSGLGVLLPDNGPWWWTTLSAAAAAGRMC